jgi:uncharacterized OsmC-like protein
MTTTASDRIDAHGNPLAFKVRERASQLASGNDRLIKVEARQMAHHQKEAVVTDGDQGTVWRLTSDEGTHLRGTDLAPFPLGFFNAGMQSDFYGQLRRIAELRKIALDDLTISLVNHYWLTGSFIQGTGEGHADAPDLEVRVASNAPRQEIEALVAAAIDASPALAFLRAALTGNTFALYINGRRRTVEGVANSDAPDAADPYRVYASAPRPLPGPADLIVKTGVQEAGAAQAASPTVTNKLIRNILGEGRPRGDGRFEVESWLGMAGASHFRFSSDESGNDTAPSGLALLSAGVSFCYMTQLSRYIENMKMEIGGVRLVQFTSFGAGDSASAGKIDTHLFLNGAAPEETHQQLLSVAARTCYLHACAKTPLEPNVRIVHNGSATVLAA